MWSPFLATRLICCYFFGLFAQDVTVDYRRGFGLVFFSPALLYTLSCICQTCCADSMSIGVLALPALK